MCSLAASWCTNFVRTEDNEHRWFVIFGPPQSSLAAANLLLSRIWSSKLNTNLHTMIYHLNDIICELKIITDYLHWGLHPRNHVTALILRKEYLAIFGLRCESTESDQPQKVHLVKIDMSTCITGCPLWLHLCALSA